MTFRDEAEALRAKLEATEAENRRLRDELRDEDDSVRRSAAARRSAARREWFSRMSDTTSRIGRGLAIIAGGCAAAFLLLYGFACLSMWSDRHVQALHDARAARMEELRSHVPDGVDPELWSWCVNHCIRYGQNGTTDTYEGVVTDVFVDHADGNGTSVRATIEGPWLNSSGATAISTTFDTESGLRHGDMIVVRHTREGFFIQQARPTPSGLP